MDEGVTAKNAHMSINKSPNTTSNQNSITKKGVSLATKKFSHITIEPINQLRETTPIAYHGTPFKDADNPINRNGGVRILA